MLGAPSVGVAVGLLAAGLAVMLAPALIRAAVARAGARAARRDAEGSVVLGSDPRGRAVALSRPPASRRTL